MPLVIKPYIMTCIWYNLNFFRPPTQIDHFCRHHTPGRNKSGGYFQPPHANWPFLQTPPTMPPLNWRGGSRFSKKNQGPWGPVLNVGDAGCAPNG